MCRQSPSLYHTRPRADFDREEYLVKIVTIVGARPQFVKAAIVGRALRAITGVQEILVHTGQHYDSGMSDVFFNELRIPCPDYNLNIGSGSHGAQTGRMLEAVERVLQAAPPDWVIVYGDTNSTLAGALAAVKLKIPVAHIEAGMRSFATFQPEEINRVLTDHVAELLFPPTPTAFRNLTREGICSTKIRLVGDVMYDAALFYAAQAETRSDILRRLHIQNKSYVLATIHRPENTDCPSRLRAIVKGLSEVARDIPVIFPLHPRTRNMLALTQLMGEVSGGLRVIDPVGYLDMAMLEKNALVIATDSGGVQKEAFFYQVLCVTLRAETEWTELVEAGWNEVVPPVSAEAVVSGLRKVLCQKPISLGSLFGDGHAAEKIVEALLDARAAKARDAFQHATPARDTEYLSI